MPYKINILLQHCNILLIGISLFMKTYSTYFCIPFLKKMYITCYLRVLFTTKLPIKQESQCIPATPPALFAEKERLKIL